jgi:hypothetical protein
MFTREELEKLLENCLKYEESKDSTLSIYELSALIDLDIAVRKLLVLIIEKEL